MLKLQAGKHSRIKKLSIAKWTSLLIIYYILWLYVLCQTFQKTLSGNPPGDLPVIVIIGLGVVVGMGWRWRSAR